MCFEICLSAWEHPISGNRILIVTGNLKWNKIFLVLAQNSLPKLVQHKHFKVWWWVWDGGLLRENWRWHSVTVNSLKPGELALIAIHEDTHPFLTYPHIWISSDTHQVAHTSASGTIATQSRSKYDRISCLMCIQTTWLVHVDTARLQ